MRQERGEREEKEDGLLTRINQINQTRGKVREKKNNVRIPAELDLSFVLIFLFTDSCVGHMMTNRFATRINTGCLGNRRRIKIFILVGRYTFGNTVTLPGDLYCAIDGATSPDLRSKGDNGNSFVFIPYG